jgi:PAS domain S-box-containing protein
MAQAHTRTTSSPPEVARPGRLVIGFMLLAIALLGAVQAVDYRHGRERARDEARLRADNLALILEEHARRTVGAIDATLRQLNLHAERIGGTAAPGAEWLPLLQSARAGLSIGALTIVDAAGTVRHSTIAAVIGQSRRANFLFQRLQANADAGLVADTPFAAASDGRVLFPFGRRLTRPDGTFDGIAVATLEPEQLRGFYRSVDVGQHGAVWLIHPSGALLLRQPATNDLPNAEIAAALAKAAQTSTSATTHFSRDGGRAQITALRTLNQPPLLLAVSLDEEEALAPWRRLALQSIWLTAAAAFVILLAGIVLARQLAARSRAERALARRERELQRAQSIAGVGSIHIDQPSLQASLSPTAQGILGRSAELPIPLDAVLDQVAATDRPRLRAAINACMRDGQSFSFELRVVRGDGSEALCRCEGTRVIEEPDGGHYVLAVLQDVTERRQTEEMLRQAQRLEAIGHLTGGVAHDFNNLLTVILGQSDTLAGDLAKDRVHGPRAAAILAAAERAAELTRRLLAFARRQPLAPRAVDVNQLVIGVDGLLRQTLGEHVEIQLVRGAGLWRAAVDPAQLENALLNLAVNARDAMPQGGRLTIETANAQIDEDYAARHGDVTPGRYVQISVADTGAGMPPEVAARAFEPFFTTKEQGKGTGLGLSMVYGFVKQSGGHIKIYSELGHGTIIRIYLPQALGDAGELEQPNAGAEPRGSETILVVEDDALVRAHAVGLLRELGYRAVAAADGQQALAALRDTPEIALLFTDMVMPGGLSGRDLAEEARRIRPMLRVLFTSGYSENSALHHGRLEPGVSLLSKPYRRPDLARLARHALDAPRR